MATATLDVRLSKIHQHLLEITDGCNEDMHEPDSQGLTAGTAGFGFDNAGGEPEELTLVIERSRSNFEQELRINMADLVALARKARI